MAVTALRAPATLSLSDRAGALFEPALRLWTALVYAFLFIPIALVVLFSFNASRLVEIWTGFSLKWYGIAWTDPSILDALRVSLTVAVINALLATVFGTLAAIGMQRVGRRTRTAFELMVYGTIVTPEIVIAIASLLFFVTINVDLGIPTIVITHVVYNTSIVALIVRARLVGMDRTLDEAAADLGATALQTLRRVTIPLLYPAILAGALLAFTFSFDDFVLTFFVSGATSTTLPLRIFSMLRFGVSPVVNAVATVMLAVTLLCIFTASMVVRRHGRGDAESGLLLAAARSAAQRRTE
ncbi:MAG TPA: ABC transporter permease [Candidatus Dormibacteraeota bacterium]|nr:ABC transporter permease [Candidatus Dormibacteraeota bacterium]